MGELSELMNRMREMREAEQKACAHKFVFVANGAFYICQRCQLVDEHFHKSTAKQKAENKTAKSLLRSSDIYAPGERPESELYDMPLEELAALAGGVQQ